MSLTNTSKEIPSDSRCPRAILSCTGSLTSSWSLDIMCRAVCTSSVHYSWWHKEERSDENQKHYLTCDSRAPLHLYPFIFWMMLPIAEAEHEFGWKRLSWLVFATHKRDGIFWSAEDSSNILKLQNRKSIFWCILTCSTSPFHTRWVYPWKYPLTAEEGTEIAFTLGHSTIPTGWIRKINVLTN